jgi:hypothetical protein
MVLIPEIHHWAPPEMLVDLPKSIATIVFDRPLSYFSCDYRVRQGQPIPFLYEIFNILKIQSNSYSFRSNPESLTPDRVALFRDSPFQGPPRSNPLKILQDMCPRA